MPDIGHADQISSRKRTQDTGAVACRNQLVDLTPQRRDRATVDMRLSGVGTTVGADPGKRSQAHAQPVSEVFAAARPATETRGQGGVDATAVADYCPVARVDEKAAPEHQRRRSEQGAQGPVGEPGQRDCSKPRRCNQKEARDSARSVGGESHRDSAPKRMADQIEALDAETGKRRAHHQGHFLDRSVLGAVRVAKAGKIEGERLALAMEWVLEERMPGRRGVEQAVKTDQGRAASREVIDAERAPTGQLDAGDLVSPFAHPGRT